MPYPYLSNSSSNKYYKSVGINSVLIFYKHTYFICAGDECSKRETKNESDREREREWRLWENHAG